MDTDTTTGTTPEATARELVDRYARALLARDEKAVADLYAVPALVLFPGQSVAVSDRAQTEQFFASAWGQYDGVTSMTADVRVVAAAGHSIWAEVGWHHGDAPGGDAPGGDAPGGDAPGGDSPDREADERFVYQLVDTGDGWRIAVLTPLAG